MKGMLDIATILSPEELSQIWADLAHNDQLPDWYELTQHGELIMSPKPSNRHQVICAEIAYQLRAQLGGKAVYEVAVLTTSAGVQVPDVVWMPEDKWHIVTIEEGLVHGPDFVVEVLSPGNRQVEINYKVQAYLASGIEEVLVVGLNGTLEFYRQDGVHTDSSFNVNLSLPPYFFQ